jgi:hypothetical protein
MSAFGGKADIRLIEATSAFDPKRTYSVPFDHLVSAGAGSPRPPRCRHDMLIQPQEANLVTYNVGLCRMVNGNLDAPYEGASIEAVNIPDALLKAKKWAASVEVADNSWLQILLGGRCVRSLKPGSF